jgi:hypothetical protein
MKWIALALAMTAVVCCTASGQTSQPAQTTWAAALSEFAASLGSNDPVVIEPKLTPTASIKSFDSDSPQGVKTLLKFAADNSTLNAHAYLHAPVQLASDIADDFREINDLDADLRKQMVPDDANLTRANTTAGQWITRTLAPTKDEAIGVIVLRSNPTDSARPTGTRGAAMFILVKGEAAAGTFHIKQIVFGDPLSATH